jgi:uncharacterized delta-60 repeat protein
MKYFAALLLGLLSLISSNAQDGSLNPGFGINGKMIAQIGLPHFRVTSGCVQTDGKIIVAGSAANDSGRKSTDLMMVRFNPDGSPDNSFGVNGIVYTDVFNRSTDVILQVKVLPGGQILALATSSWYYSKMLLFRYKSNGDPDSSFGGLGTYRKGAINIDVYVKDFLVQPDGKILLCHDDAGATNGFPSKLSLLRYNADGTADNTLKIPNGNGYPFGEIDNVFLQADGKIMLAGKYVSQYMFKPYIARLFPDGKIDSSFALNGIQDVTPTSQSTYAVHARADSLNRILLCTAHYLSPSDSLQVTAYRFMPNGTPDLSFGVQGAVTLADSTGGSFIDNLPAFQIMTGNKILFPVTSIRNRQVREMAAMRLDANWQKDAGFGSSGVGIIPSAPDAFEAVATIPAPNGRIYIAGYDLSHGRYRVALGALLADGTPDLSFSVDAKTSVEAGMSSHNEDGFVDMLVHPNGKITTAGLAENGPSSSLVINRFRSNGLPDSSFGTAGKRYLSLKSRREYGPGDFYRRHSLGQVIVLKQDAAGNLLIVCDEYHLPGRKNVVVMYKLSFDGILDNSFGDAGRTTIDFSSEYYNYVRGLAMQSDGKLLVASFIGMPIYDSSYTAIMRLLPNGKIDSSFGNQGKLVDKYFMERADYQLSAPNQLMVQPDDKILMTGQPKQFIYVELGLRRYTANGQLDTAFRGYNYSSWYPHTGVTRSTAIAMQPDGKILLAGKTDGHKFIARFDQNGNYDGYFGDNGRVYNVGKGNTSSILVQPDGKILVMGDSYIDYPGWKDESYIEVSRILADGSMDNAFGNAGKVRYPLSVPYGDLAANIGLLPDGNIVIAGVTGIDWDPSHNLGIPQPVLYGLTNTIQNCLPVTVEAGPDTVICRSAGPGATLGAPAVPGVVYSWMPTTALSNATIAQPVASPFLTTRYAVKLTSPVGCVAIDTVLVMVEVPVVLPLSANGSISFCNGQSVQLSTTATGNLQWLKNDLPIPGANGPSYTATDSGLYRVIQVTGQHCTPSSNATQVTLYPPEAKPVITHTGTTLVSSAAYAYQWYLEGVLVGGAYGQTFVPHIPGNYTVATRSANGCRSSPSIPFAFVLTGINSPELEKKIILGPNPVKEQLFIQYTGNFAVFDVALFDLTGQHVLASGKFSTTIRFNMQPYAAGMYILQIKNNKTGEYLQKKIFKEHD